MAFTVNTNVSSLTAQSNLASSQMGLSSALGRLSSGLRINSAQDDAAGLAVSQVMQEAITGLRQANRNANDGISLGQTAEGGMKEILNILQRMRELAIQGSNGTLSTGNLANLDAEFQNLDGEIDRIAAKSNFNGIQLLDGTAASVTIHVGDGTNATNDQIAITLTDVDSTALGINGLDVTSNANALTAAGTLDTAINTVTTAMASLGADISNLQAHVRFNDITTNNLEASKSRITDADFALESANFAKFNILNQTGISMLAQANALPNGVLNLLG